MITQEQAQQAANAQNERLNNSGVADQRFQIFETFTPNFQSTWDICNVPTIYNQKYTDASTAQIMGFARVSRNTILTVGIGAAYVAAFQTEAAGDAVLGPYLGL